MMRFQPAIFLRDLNRNKCLQQRFLFGMASKNEQQKLSDEKFNKMKTESFAKIDEQFQNRSGLFMPVLKIGHKISAYFDLQAMKFLLVLATETRSMTDYWISEYPFKREGTSKIVVIDENENEIEVPVLSLKSNNTTQLLKEGSK